jgi:membrane protein
VPVIDSVKQRVSDVRERRPVVDHLVRALEHYGQVNGSALAAAVTYFAFLSFFPILALAFAIFGQVTKVYEDAQDTLVDAANSVLPNLVGGESGVPLDTLQAAAPGIFSVGILLTLYSGLGWLSGMRSALMAIFEEPEREQPSFLLGKLRDVLALMALGTILVASVAVSGVVTKVLTPITEWLDLGVVAEVFFWVLALCLGLAANTLLYFAFFRLLAQPDIPSRSLLSGALLGAVLFELLKQLSTFLLRATANSDAFQAFGIALILLVWINYFSRVVVLSAAWAHTTPEARALRDAHRVADQMPEGPRIDLAAAAPGVLSASRSASPASPASPKAAFAAGAASMLGLVALLRRRG